MACIQTKITDEFPRVVGSKHPVAAGIEEIQEWICAFRSAYSSQPRGNIIHSLFRQQKIRTHHLIKKYLYRGPDAHTTTTASMSMRREKT